MKIAPEIPLVPQGSTVRGERDELNLVIAGHVDHGKSTIIGRLLADTGSLPQGKLEAVRENCRRNSKPFEYAFLLDALKEEQAQGITIDVARCFFKTKKRNYLIIDAPGHIEFLKNMVTGASWAEAALLVIDALEGVQENSRRHGYMLSLLGIRQICVLVNKMDLVSYNESTFQQIKDEYSAFLQQVGVEPLGFIPVSGMEGDNIAIHSAHMPWYNGPIVLEQIDTFKATPPPDNKPFRMPVQDVYKFTGNGDTRRIIAGRVETGQISVGDQVIFYPSGKKSTVKTIETQSGDQPLPTLTAGWSAGFSLSEQIYVRRGEIAARSDEPKPLTATRLRASIFWLGRQPLEVGKKYLFKLGTARIEMEIESILRTIDASTLDTKNTAAVNRNDVAECIIKTDQMIAFDLAVEMPETGRFVIVDDYEISGGGVIIEALEDRQTLMRSRAQQRNERWENSAITDEERAERYNQKSCLLLITGAPEDTLRKQVAKLVEEKLFQQGKLVYFIGMANLLYGMDADIRQGGDEVHAEHFRRLAEVAHLMLDAGVILVVSVRHISHEDLQILATDLTDRADRIITVWVGDHITTDLAPNLHIPAAETPKAVEQIKRLLQDQGYIYRAS